MNFKKIGDVPKPVNTCTIMFTRYTSKAGETNSGKILKYLILQLLHFNNFVNF